MIAQVVNAVKKFFGRAKVNPGPGRLLPYQIRWVHDKSRLKLAEKSRQIGWTWATAFGLVRRKAVASAANDAWVSSRDELQARLFLEDCSAFAKLLKIGADDLGEKVIDAGGNTAFVLRMDSGARIHSMSSNPDAQAGKRGDRVLDEFAVHPNPRLLYGIAYPGITWGGQLEIFSTHRGTGNFFNELIQEVKYKGNPKGFSLHTVTLQQALEQGFLYKLQTKLPHDDPRQEMDEAQYFDFIKAGCADAETFAQEFCCQPDDDAAAFLSYDLITPCEFQATEQWEKELTACGPLYIGVDIGRLHDLTVIWVLERSEERLLTRRMIVMDRQSFAAQRDALYTIMSLDNVRRCCIDQTGIGRQFTEEAREKFRSRVEGVDFTADKKQELAEPLRVAFEDKTIRIPQDRNLRADLRSIRKSSTAAGNVRYEGERTTGGHADRFWALALAKYAAKQPKANVWLNVC
jgi:phage FluMu gp28-like protein